MLNKYCIILSGPSGSGKTTVATYLWKNIPHNPAYLCLDSIKHLVNGAISNDHYLDLARNNALSMMQNFLIAGHPVIIDKAFGAYSYVEPFIKLANDLSVKAYYFKLYAPLNVLIERVENRRNFSAEELLSRGEWLHSTGNTYTVTKIFHFFERNKHCDGIEINSLENSLEDIIEIIQGYIGKFN
jgi:predicted kinase